MTDNEIIKALECCNGWDGRCLNCPLNREGTNCKEKLNSYALDLINRHKADIERLEKETKDKERAYNDEFCLRKEWQTKCRELLKDKQTTKFEAIKEFAERVKEKLQWDVEFDNKLVFESDIDNLVKEMTEVQK